MRMTIQQLDELVKLLELFKKDETIKKIDKEGKLKAATRLIEETAMDLIV